MSVHNENNRDPRARLIREKYFSIRPRPLERWLWAQGIPASAERVFWLHWQEGTQRGDWCSEIPIRRVARECSLDVSTVTRAYQLLAKLGCVRRTDPGRNPANPFQQATALTEVRLPSELLAELNQHPNRRSGARKEEGAEAGRAFGESEPEAAASEVEASVKPSDPLAGLRGRDRVRALEQMTRAMSATERNAYLAAMRMHQATMAFDADSKVQEEERALVMRVLASMAETPVANEQTGSPAASPSKAKARKLSLFEVARLRRDIQSASSIHEGPELLRQVIWSVEAGALKRFGPVHAIHIALKKIREGAWTRPHRMPPNWVPAVSGSAVPETCRVA